MKRIFSVFATIIVMCCYSKTGIAQRLVAAEYFLNVDPGIGNGTAIGGLNADSVHITFSIPATGLPLGFSQLFIRARDENNNWGIAESRTIYVSSNLQTSLSPLTAAEYFMDTDPGVGNGIAINLQSADSIKQLVPISTQGMTTGFHHLFIRVKDQNDHWSITEQRAFYIDATISNRKQDIVRAEYYIDMDSGIGVGNAVPLTPAPTIDTNYGYTAAGLAQGPHTMSLRVQDASGNWSIVESRPFTVCSEYGPVSGFDFAVSDSSVSFINQSTYASASHWIFGDGDTSDLTNPLHVYKPGVYNAFLVSRNDCLPSGDTVYKTVTVAGLASISSAVGGNTGDVSVTIAGGGFVPGMQLFLLENGQKISGDTLVVQSSSIMTTTFNLAGKPIGTCDVVGEFPNGKIDTLYQAFKIVAGDSARLWVSITGDRVLRLGFNQVYTVTFGNSGNTDADLVPLAVYGLPLGTNIQILDSLVSVSSIPGDSSIFQSNPTLSHTIDDSAEHMSFRLFLLRKIPAGSSSTLQFIFHVPFTTTLHSTGDIQVLLGAPLNINTTTQPLPESTTRHVITAGIQPLGSSESPTPPTASSCFLGLLNAAADAFFNNLPSTNFAACMNGARNLITGTITDWAEFTKEPNHTTFGGTTFAVGEFTDFIKSGVDVTINCAEAATKVVLEEVAWEAILAKSVVDLSLNALKNSEHVAACAGSLYKAAKNYLSVIFGNAWDPNSKYGIGDGSDNHYTNGLPLSYLINFENDPSANANAQTIQITDTLQAGSFDLSSFGFNAVMVGSTVYSFTNPVRSFVQDLDFTAQYGVKARITATFDSVKGIAQWSLFSIDPVTNQQTTQAAAGFLPPDVTSPNGTGYVSFTVKPAAGTTDGARICNKATIVFDANPPITTNCFANVFDLTSPASRIQPLQVISPKDSFTVNWQGSDNLSGVRTYSIYVSVNDSAFVPWVVDTTSTNGIYGGKDSTTYGFYSIATDNAGNVESPKILAESTTSVQSGTPLPLTLLAFADKCSTNGVVLSWQTSNQINVSRFVLQRSADDSSTWSNIGSVPASTGGSATQAYHYTDLQSDGSFLYRLSIVDNNGGVTYSQVLHSDCTVSGLGLTVYPSPANSLLNAAITWPYADKVVVFLTDVNGRIVKEINASLQNGQNVVAMDVSGLAAGVYFLKVQGMAGVAIGKVVISR